MMKSSNIPHCFSTNLSCRVWCEVVKYKLRIISVFTGHNCCSIIVIREHAVEMISYTLHNYIHQIFR